MFFSPYYLVVDRKKKGEKDRGKGGRGPIAPRHVGRRIEERGEGKKET